MIHLLDAQLHIAVLDTFEAEFGKRPADAQIQIQSTRAEFDGDRTLVVFPLAGMAGAPPHVAAERLGEALTARHDWIDNFGVVKGFLNLTLSWVGRYWPGAGSARKVILELWLTRFFASIFRISKFLQYYFYI